MLWIDQLTPAVAVAAVTGLFGMLFAWWQRDIAREKLKFDLYDRRFAIYMAFHELLLATAEKDDWSAEFKKALTAKANTPFLLDKSVEMLLDDLCSQTFALLQEKRRGTDKTAWASEQERIEAAATYGGRVLAQINRLGELRTVFMPFLALDDFRNAKKE